MPTYLFRPKWIAIHVLVISLIVVMLNLADWQWSRHNERKEFNTTLIERFDADTRPLADLLTSGSPEQIEWLPAEVSGAYLANSDISLVNVSQNGVAGYDAITAMEMTNGTIVLINRGFLPLAAPFPPAPDGQVTLVGRLRASDVRKLGEISEAPTGSLTEVFRIDIDRLAPQLGGELAPVYVQLLKSSPPEDPNLAMIADPTFDNGSHLGYTVQWIIFSICAVGAWIVLVRREMAKRK
jgi:cytochrome oxidase assembly protein ShyY1